MRATVFMLLYGIFYMHLNRLEGLEEGFLGCTRFWVVLVPTRVVCKLHLRYLKSSSRSHLSVFWVVFEFRDLTPILRQCCEIFVNASSEVGWRMVINVSCDLFRTFISVFCVNLGDIDVV